MSRRCPVVLDVQKEREEEKEGNKAAAVAVAEISQGKRILNW